MPDLRPRRAKLIKRGVTAKIIWTLLILTALVCAGPFLGLLSTSLQVQQKYLYPKPHLDELFGTDEKTMKQAEFIAAVALTAADRLYSKLTKDDFALREREEH
jgi:hypothetical protein